MACFWGLIRPPSFGFTSSTNGAQTDFERLSATGVNQSFSLIHQLSGKNEQTLWLTFSWINLYRKSCTKDCVVIRLNHLSLWTWVRYNSYSCRHDHPKTASWWCDEAPLKLSRYLGKVWNQLVRLWWDLLKAMKLWPCRWCQLINHSQAPISRRWKLKQEPVDNEEHKLLLRK